jgi:hypothetical protein
MKIEAPMRPLRRTKALPCTAPAKRGIGVPAHAQCCGQRHAGFGMRRTISALLAHPWDEVSAANEPAVRFPL